MACLEIFFFACNIKFLGGGWEVDYVMDVYFLILTLKLLDSSLQNI